MSLISAPFPGLPFMQPLALVVVEAVLPFVVLGIIVWLLIGRLPQIMQLVNRLTGSRSDYRCNCSRCQAELRTKKGIKRWRRYNREKNRYDRDAMK